MASAAQLMNMDATTVSRRLRELQAVSGKQLYTKASDGTLTLTERAEVIVKHVEAMEIESEFIAELLGEQNVACSGLVRVTSVPIIVNHILTPNLGSLLNEFPELQIDLLPYSQKLNLSFREADVAIRLARPKSGGTEILTKRLKNLYYGVYAADKLSSEQGEALPWLGFDDDMFSHPIAQWIYNRAGSRGEEISNLRIQNSETGLEAAIAGIGKALLPELIGDNNPFLQRLSGPGSETYSEVWLLTHKSRHGMRRTKETVKWLEKSLAPK